LPYHLVLRPSFKSLLTKPITPCNNPSSSLCSLSPRLPLRPSSAERMRPGRARSMTPATLPKPPATSVLILYALKDAPAVSLLKIAPLSRLTPALAIRRQARPSRVSLAPSLSVPHPLPATLVSPTKVHSTVLVRPPGLLRVRDVPKTVFKLATSPPPPLAPPIPLALGLQTT